MKTYKISFYPGLVLPRPYFVTVDEPTTNYQALLDILVDEQLQGADGLFDDDNELPEDMVTIAGNEGRRLITGGGMLNISEIDLTDINNLILDKTLDIIEGTVNVFFGDDDETQFEVSSSTELAELWLDFCEENDFDVASISGIEVLGFEEYDVDIYATESGSVHVRVPYGSDSEIVLETAMEAEEAGNAYFFDRTVVAKDEAIPMLAYKILELEDFENFKNPKMAEIIKLSLEYLTLGGLEDAKRGSDIEDEIFEIGGALYE